MQIGPYGAAMISPRLPPAIMPIEMKEWSHALTVCGPLRPLIRPNTPSDSAPPTELHSASDTSLASGKVYEYLISVLEVPQHNSAISDSGIQCRAAVAASVPACESTRPAYQLQTISA